MLLERAVTEAPHAVNAFFESSRSVAVPTSPMSSAAFWGRSMFARDARESTFSVQNM